MHTSTRIQAARLDSYETRPELLAEFCKMLVMSFAYEYDIMCEIYEIVYDRCQLTSTLIT